MRLTIGAILALFLGASSAVAGQESSPGPQPPTLLLGEFVDDYGIEYSISRDAWSQGAEARYEILEWDVEGRSIIARNADTNRGEAGLWTRIDWVLLDGASADYRWAFCYAVYDAPDPESASAAARTSRASPRTGCNGFPFSRMKRVQ